VPAQGQALSIVQSVRHLATISMMAEPATNDERAFPLTARRRAAASQFVNLCVQAFEVKL
jgi:hypothetical protein